MKKCQHLIGESLLQSALLASVLILCLSFGTPALAEQPSEQYKIVFLLNTVSESNLVFIRNGTEYTGEQARDHLQNKLDAAGDRIHTAEDFISYLASKSMITGTPYYVRLPDGTQLEAATWLRKKLATVK